MLATTVPDLRTVALPERLAAAERVRTARDFTLPPLAYFNAGPCAGHDSVEQGQAQIPPCRTCGVKFRKHQRVGIAWLYLRGRGLIGDQVGTGKTAQAAGLLALCKEAGEFDHRRAIVVCRPSALAQWQQELQRFLPSHTVAVAVGARDTRIARYSSDWDVLLIGYQMLNNDLCYIPEGIGLVVVDDVDPLRNSANRTAQAIKALAATSDRAVILTATPLQKQLEELYSVLEPVGAADVFGSASAFRKRYVREQWVRVYNPRAGRHINQREVLGYQNLDEFQALVAPLVLRRTPADIDDVDLPVISPHTVYLDLHPAQTARYADLRRGVLTILKAEGAKVKQAKAAAAFLYGAQICAGLVTLGEPDGPGGSAKLDWVMAALAGDLAEEKTVVFCQFTNTIEALHARLDTAGIGHSIIWGRDSDKTNRAEAVRRFWDDADCRVLIGSPAIEQSLNLQVARHLICVDQIMNPARMQQLAGRIRRDGSGYTTVYVHNLLARQTQEEGYLDLLAREQALADHVWSESNQLYERLDPVALLELIGHGRRM